MDGMYFNYQHVECLYTLFKYQFGGKSVVKSIQLFDEMQRAVHFNTQNRGMDRMLIMAKKQLLRKKYKKRLLSSLQNTKSTRTIGSIFADRIEQFKSLNPI